MKQYAKVESVKLIFGGKNYFEVLDEIISSAKKVIHLQTYIFEEDEVGKQVAKKLEDTAKRGVKVFVLADAYGSKGLSRKFIDEMKTAGINFRLFSPLFSSESIYLGRRLHHKIIVADNQTGLIGGINIAQKYKGTAEEPAWLDYAVLVKGNACLYLHELCEQIYKKKKFRMNEIYPVKDYEGSHYVRFRRNDWIKRKNEVYKSYIEALKTSKKSITIVASYFLPGFFFKRQLKKAIQRGVKIRIVEAGKTDTPFFRLAEKYLYSYLLKIGVEIYEWQNSVMHGKALLVDDKMAIVGSYNLNYLSRYRSIELNVDVMDNSFSKTFSEHLNKIISCNCSQITSKELPTHKGIFSSLKTTIAYHFFRLLMKLLMPR